MTLTEIEQRLCILEQTVAEMQKRWPAFAPTNKGDEESTDSEEELIPGAEYPLVLSVPPYEEFEVKATIRSVQHRQPILGLSDPEWEGLHLERDGAC